MWTLSLDATQKELIARLEASREAWHTTAAYDPERSQDPPAVRQKAGALLRKQVPHAAHAAWKPPRHRPSPVDIVVAGNAGRQEHLVPLRMARMSASPFAFLRGAAAVMAWDLSHTPVSGIQVFIDGDAHINNFGFYGSPQRDVIVDLNDFDEATIGPWEWDLKRLVASVNVAGRENGMSRKERRRAVLQAAFGYRCNAARVSTMGVLEVWSLFAYAERVQRVIKVPRKAWALVQKVVAKAKATTNETLLPKVAQRRHDGGWRFVEDPPILTPSTRRRVGRSPRRSSSTPRISPPPTASCCAATAWRTWPTASWASAASARAPTSLCSSATGISDPLFLQVKEATLPAHAPYLPALPMRGEHQGLRVIAGQRALQSLGDPMLGHTTIDGRQYYVRQMKNMKASMPVAFMTGVPFDFWAFACGMLLARAHARSGDAARIAGYCGDGDTLDSALADFAEAYGDQTERDHAELVQAIKRGRVPSAS